jgi:hypothetical protein
MNRCRDASLLMRYFDAKAVVVAAGFGWEIDWQDAVNPATVNETTFLREAAWVVLSAGLKERVVRCVFPSVSEALLGFGSAVEISRAHRGCRDRALRVFKHPGKVDAILGICQFVALKGHVPILDAIRETGPEVLQQFPYLGPATSRHLAKNLGFCFAKPDRHLMRMALAWGCESVHAMCGRLASLLGESVAVVDVVLWRYAVLQASPLTRDSQPSMERI